MSEPDLLEAAMDFLDRRGWDNPVDAALDVVDFAQPYIEALKKIRDMDYRGNRHPSSGIAAEALQKKPTSPLLPPNTGWIICSSCSHRNPLEGGEPVPMFCSQCDHELTTVYQ